MPDQARIVIVEDTLSLARVYQDYLRADSHLVDHVVSGTDAIDRLRQDPPDVLVLDLVLPDMDGREVLRTASQIAPDCKIVVITAHGSVNIKMEKEEKQNIKTGLTTHKKEEFYKIITQTRKIVRKPMKISHRRSHRKIRDYNRIKQRHELIEENLEQRSLRQNGKYYEKKQKMQR